MNDKLQQAFNSIRAEEALKENTMEFINNKRICHARKYPVRRLAVALAFVFILSLSGVYSYRVYATPDAYMDVDMNPSIELTLNRFNRVIGVHAYNDDGEKILELVDLKNKSSQDALDILLQSMEEEGYMENSELLSITVQSGNKTDKLVQSVKKHMDCAMEGHHAGMSQEIYSIDANLKASAYELDMSPAQYLAALELKKADPSVTFEDCQNHCISELREITSEHAGGHHNGNSDIAEEEQNSGSGNMNRGKKKNCHH